MHGMLYHLALAAVLPAKQVVPQVLWAQRPNPLNPPLPRREQAHAVTVLQDSTSQQRAPALVLIAGHALQDTTFHSVVCSVKCVQQESLRWPARINARIFVKLEHTRQVVTSDLGSRSHAVS